MQVLLLLADYANTTPNGKLNVLGIFDQINANQFPAAHLSMMAIAKISLELGERVDVPRPMALRMLTEDGEPIVELTTELKFPPQQDNKRPEVNIIVQLANVTFPQPGRYELKLFINEETRAVTPIQVNQLQPST